MVCKEWMKTICARETYHVAVDQAQSFTICGNRELDLHPETQRTEHKQKTNPNPRKLTGEQKAIQMSVWFALEAYRDGRWILKSRNTAYGQLIRVRS